MSDFLLSISLGPVQDFIAAARRTRDLWFGSHVLSEMSKAAAKEVSGKGAQLIFPSPSDMSKLEPGSDFTAPNKILALVPEGLDPRVIADQARKAAEKRWDGFAERALENSGKIPIDRSIWDDQIHDLIEFYSAWVPWTGPSGYCQARERLELIMAGRKALRDFAPAKGRIGVRKSSLDGARESVIRTSSTVDKSELARDPRIRPGEELDAIGFVKRFSYDEVDGPNTRFPSVSRVAADTWLRGHLVTDDGREAIATLSRLCHSHFAPRIDLPVYKEFPFEADVFYPSRLEEMLRDPRLEQHWPSLKEIRDIMKDKLGGQGPYPYFAIVLADGDRVGKLLSEMESVEQHRALSEALSAFALEASRIFERHRGCLVYCGGDDVLGFAPIETALCIGRELHDEFSEYLSDVSSLVTLSVGIAIGHHLEPLGTLLTYARQAERAAKEGTNRGDKRNGLAIHFHTRGGGHVEWRDQWHNNPDARLKEKLNLFLRGSLPGRLPYEIYNLARDYSGWQGEEPTAHQIQIDAKRVLKRKTAGDVKLPDEVIASMVDGLRVPADIEFLGRELLLARALAGGYRWNTVDKGGAYHEPEPEDE